MKPWQLDAGTLRTRFAWWPVNIRRMEGCYLDPMPVRRVWLKPVTELLTYDRNWIAYERHQDLPAPGGLAWRPVFRIWPVHFSHGADGYWIGCPGSHRSETLPHRSGWCSWVDRAAKPGGGAYYRPRAVPGGCSSVHPRAG